MISEIEYFIINIRWHGCFPWFFMLSRDFHYAECIISTSRPFYGPAMWNISRQFPFLSVDGRDSGCEKWNVGWRDSRTEKRNVNLERSKFWTSASFPMLSSYANPHLMCSIWTLSDEHDKRWRRCSLPAAAAVKGNLFESFDSLASRLIKKKSKIGKKSISDVVLSHRSNRNEISRNPSETISSAVSSTNLCINGFFSH